MKLSWTAMLVLLVLGLASASAIDRNARMIDTVSVDLQELNDVDGIGLSLLSEILLAPEREDWALLAGGGFGTISPDGTSTVAPDGSLVTTSVPNVDYWTVGVGLKFYLAPVTSFSAFGSYSEYETRGVEREAKAATFTAMQRLAPSTGSMSPFAKGSYTMRDRSTFSSAGTSGSFSENIFSIGGGIEFWAGDNFSFVFEAARVESDSSKDSAEDLDGWTGAFAMRYYFPQK